MRRLQVSPPCPVAAPGPAPGPAGELEEVVLEGRLVEVDLGVADVGAGQRREELGDVVLVDLDVHCAVLYLGGQSAVGGVTEQVLETSLDAEAHRGRGGRGRELFGPADGGDLPLVQEEDPV